MNSEQNNYFLLVQNLVMMIILNILERRKVELGWHNNEEINSIKEC